MKIIKYSRISEINIGDVIISDSINYLDRKLFNNKILNKDILFEHFDIESRIVEEKKNKANNIYNVRRRGIIMSFLIILIKKILFNLKDKKKITNEIRSNDVVIIGGGNIFSEKNGSDLFYRVSQIAKITKKLNKKLIVYAVGVGPFEFAYKNRLGEIINLSDSFNVRDVKSKEISTIGISPNKDINIVLDPAFIISDIYPKLEREPKYIGLNFMNFSRIVKNSSFDINSVVENLVDLHMYYKLPFKIVNTSFGEDLSICMDIKERLRAKGINTVIFNIKKISDLPKAYSDLSFFLASRMHSSIFAMSYYIPTLIYPWHQKVDSLETLLFSNDKKNILLKSENFNSKEIIEKIEFYSIKIDLKKIISKEKSKIYQSYNEIIRSIQ